MLVPMSVLVEHKHVTSTAHDIKEAQVTTHINFSVTASTEWTAAFVFKLDDKSFGDSIKQVIASLSSGAGASSGS